MADELPLNCGDEYDAFTGWKRVTSWRAGKRARIKRNYRRRCRRAAAMCLRKEKEQIGETSQQVVVQLDHD